MPSPKDPPRIYLVAVVVVLFLAGPWTGSSAGELGDPFPFTARIKLEVSGDDATAAIAKSYLSRELRRLDGIVVTDDDPRYHLSVIVMETSSQGGYTTGYALSSVGLSLWQKSSFESLMEAARVSDTQKSLLHMLANESTVVHHLLQTGPSDSLETLCARLVGAFDTSAMEEARKMMQQIKEMQRGATGRR